MATHSRIEWTEMTWNPVTGCTKVSQGCKNCYAERMAARLQAMGSERYRRGFRVMLHPDLVMLPKKWKRGRTIFVNSMSDLFHEEVPDDFVRAVFGTMCDCPQHTFQILTKRSDRLRSLASTLPWSSNIWMGVSVEDARVMHRVNDLRATPAKVRFLSCEPLIGRLDNLRLHGIHWVIVGGESGPKARQMNPSWAVSLLRQCRAAGVAFFMKQMGGKQDKRGDLRSIPASLRVRQYPELFAMPKLAA
ncbi:MAG TPA: phage Gp37/Gp68 family protein [Burkholderiales bacterium]|nr:phage Gp37/Gp68 family protein [Burkholderiales bacterium]